MGTSLLPRQSSQSFFLLFHMPNLKTLTMQLNTLELSDKIPSLAMKLGKEEEAFEMCIQSTKFVTFSSCPSPIKNQNNNINVIINLIMK